MKKVMGVIVCTSLAVAAGALLTGCKDKSAPSSGSNMNMDNMGDHAQKTADTMAKDATKMADNVTEQTICPVMGNPINKEYYTEYKGKKVYFCCPDCKAVFEKDPEKYIKDLPQFK